MLEKNQNENLCNENLYIVMNKPAGYVCSAVSDSHKTVYELLPPEMRELVTKPKRGHRLHTVGRLDCDTSGLLFLTTDGHFSHRLTSPENKIEKTYIARLKTPGNLSYIEKAEKGLILPPEKKAPQQLSLPAFLKPLDSQFLLWQVKITEGKFHQVRRIFLSLQNEVEHLQRTKIGNFELPPMLKEGDFLEIRHPDEINI